MGILNWFSKPAPAVHRLPVGSFTVDRYGNVLTATVATAIPQQLLGDVAHEVLSLFREARTASMPLAELNIQFADYRIMAREMQGGAIIFLSPKTPVPLARPSL